ncbi:putative Sjoegren syndrome/scleroderma autoantigen 1-like [Homarus americanus]|uniref:Putative Sjoegren syndrome/scleroderma autoantigen 1-like n=2 Tax=Homarus americanus TaxID=6706 RepID=A0A8J5JYU6_HOMAM|nr:putative Sjoegren syndrome/scleroderma autoantigen 1-like [Homarus americanus]
MTNKYCIGCCEVDADTKKDNPAVSEQAARRAVEETQHRQNPETELSVLLAKGGNSQQMSSVATSQTDPTHTSQSVATSTTDTNTSSENHSKKSIIVHGVNLSEDATATINVLREKLVWAKNQLLATTSVHEAQKLVELITEVCKAITALRDL